MLRSLRAATLALAVCYILGFGALPVWAQSIDISPTVGTYKAGQGFSVRVLVSSPSQSVNAVSGTLNFSSDTLQALSVSKGSSVMSLWVTEPAISNSAGTVDFAGVILNPGFTGSGGTIITINFRARKAGKAELQVSQGSILANDGNGTDILRKQGTASYDIEEAAPVEPTSAATAPLPFSFTIQDMRAGDLTIRALPLKMIASGGTMPVDRYEFTFDDSAAAFVWKPDTSGVYTAPTLSSGRHSVKARAFDAEGRVAEATLSFEVFVPSPTSGRSESWWSLIFSSLLGMLPSVVLIIALIVLLIMLILHSLKHTRSFRQIINKEAEEALATVHSAFGNLRENMESYIGLIEGAGKERHLTEEEKKLFKLMRRDLDKAEKAIGKEVGDIEKKTHILR